jgi:hypothetical protein
MDKCSIGMEDLWNVTDWEDQSTRSENSPSAILSITNSIRTGIELRPLLGAAGNRTPEQWHGISCFLYLCFNSCYVNYRKCALETDRLSLNPYCY